VNSYFSLQRLANIKAFFRWQDQSMRVDRKSERRCRKWKEWEQKVGRVGAEQSVFYLAALPTWSVHESTDKGHLILVYPAAVGCRQHIG